MVSATSGKKAEASETQLRWDLRKNIIYYTEFAERRKFSIKVPGDEALKSGDFFSSRLPPTKISKFPDGDGSNSSPTGAPSVSSVAPSPAGSNNQREINHDQELNSACERDIFFVLQSRSKTTRG